MLRIQRLIPCSHIGRTRLCLTWGFHHCLAREPRQIELFPQHTLAPVVSGLRMLEDMRPILNSQQNSWLGKRDVYLALLQRGLLMWLLLHLPLGCLYLRAH